MPSEGRKDNYRPSLVNIRNAHMKNGSDTRVTMKDIALKSGFSINTISRALHDDGRLSKETRTKIKQISKALGYIPNHMASALRSGKSRIVAVIVNDLHNQHFTILLEDLNRELRELGYSMMTFCMQLNEALGEQLIRTSISLAVEGILYFPFHNNSAHIEILKRNHVPFVLIDRWIQGVEADCVRIDDFDAGYQAGKHLAELGHRRFLHLAGVLSSSSEIERIDGFTKALDEAGIEPGSVRVVAWDALQEAIVNNTLQALLLPMDYTAIFSFSDELAYHILNELEKLHLSVPADVSVISIDHIRSSIPYLPQLTSIASQNSHIATSAVRTLLRRMAQPDLPPISEILHVKLFDEGTTAAPAQKR